MKDYHFEKGDREFDQTIRLDSINEQIKHAEQEHPQQDIDEELGDKNDFLKAFESEKLDPPSEEERKEETEEPKQQEPPVPPPAPAGGNGGSREDKEKEERNKQLIGIISICAVVVCILAFFIVRRGLEAMPAEGEAVPMLVESVITDGEYMVYDIHSDKRRTLSVTEDTVITDSEGAAASAKIIRQGDVCMVETDQKGETARSVDYSTGVEDREKTGLIVDPRERTIRESKEDGGDLYKYHKKTMFFHGEDELDPKDIAPCDLVRLRVVDRTVWSAEVLEYHGYIIIENISDIKNGMVQIDGGEKIPLDKNKSIPVRAGEHKLTISGDNIETKTKTVSVEENEKYIYDLSKAQEKTGVLMVNANVSDYKLYLNGELTDASSPAVLPLGEYDVVILKKGYEEWNRHITLKEGNMTLDAELTEEVSYGTLNVSSNVEDAVVYIDGAAKGAAPLEQKLPYGIYTVRVEKEGMEAYEADVVVDSPTASVYASLY